MAKKYPLTNKEFSEIYSKVPRLTVEVLIQGEEGIFLTKRSIEPCKNQWHIPGGTVYFGESLVGAVQRIAERELNIKVSDVKFRDYIEYPSHYQNGLDCPIGLVFQVLSYAGEVRSNEEAENSGWFTKSPANMHADQDVYLVKNNFLDA